MSFNTKLPTVLQSTTNCNSSISLERALKQAIDLLEQVQPDNESHEDKLNATLDDLQFMLANIDRN